MPKEPIPFPFALPAEPVDGLPELELVKPELPLAPAFAEGLEFPKENPVLPEAGAPPAPELPGENAELPEAGAPAAPELPPSEKPEPEDEPPPIPPEFGEEGDEPGWPEPFCPFAPAAPPAPTPIVCAWPRRISRQSSLPVSGSLYRLRRNR